MMLLREAKRVLYRWFSRQTEPFIKLKRLGETALNFNPYKRQTLRVYLTLLFRAVRLQDTYYVNNVGEIECILFGFVFSNCQYHLANMLFLLKVLLCLTNFSAYFNKYIVVAECRQRYVFVKCKRVEIAMFS